MSTQIQTWIQEHRNFSRLLQLLDDEIAAFHEGERPDYELMLDVMYYMTHYPDSKHHPLEDAAFSELARLAPTLNDEISALFEQHREIARSGNELADALQGVLGGAVMEREAVERRAAAYGELMRAHMKREESCLFPQLDERFDDNNWLRVHAAVSHAEDPLFGDSVAERYRRLHGRIARQAGCDCAV